MRLIRIIFMLGLVCTTGCLSGRLRQRTVDLGSTLPELQYQQVLGNLALFAKNPSALPWHVNIREATTQITDSASAGALVDLGPPATTQPQLFGSRTAVAQWGMSPVIEPVQLELLRYAYRRAHGNPEMPSPDFLSDLSHDLKGQFESNADLRDESVLFYEFEGYASKNSIELESRIITTNDDNFLTAPVSKGSELSPLAKNVRRKIATIERDLAMIQPGWFSVGSKWDVPRDACYVGKCGDCYVWVDADGREALTEFTLVVMKITSLVKESQSLISPGTVKFSPGDRGG